MLRLDGRFLSLEIQNLKLHPDTQPHIWHCTLVTEAQTGLPRLPVALADFLRVLVPTL